ncbi:MAG: YlaF family protein [Chloroflexi bacterium]|nr:YlaF family protein [Chloroflexota bacterium]
MEEPSQQIPPWSPPAGYVAVPSQVEGVVIYAPAADEETEETQTFRCRYCGGTIAYEPGQQGLACPFCGRKQEIEAEQVGRAAEKYEFTLETMAHALHGWGSERRELVCEACGSVVTVAPMALTSTCAFCGSNRVLARSVVTSDLLRPTALIPFSIDAAQLETRVQAWLGQGWMHPSGLHRSGILRDLVGVYLPYWTFDTDVRADWQAEVGRVHTERYRVGGEWHTRTVIRWRWQSGRVRFQVADLLVAGTHRVSQAILRKVGPFDLEGLATYDPGYLAGWQAKVYDIALHDAWEAAKEQIRENAREACHEDTGSAHVRSLQMAVDFAHERWRHILLPVYLASYRYEGRPFHVMVNGQNGQVAGQKPVDWLRVWLVIAAMLLPGACLGMIGLLTLAVGGIGIIGLALGFILLIAGLVGGFLVLKKARESEEI